MALRRLEGRLTQNRIDALRAKIGTNARGLPPQLPVGNPWVARALICAPNTGQGQ
jgi:hypothetical protein